MLRRCTRENGVSRGTRTSLRRSLSVTSAARSISDRLVPWAIAARVPIEQGHTTIPNVFTDPDAGWAPRSVSLKARTRSEEHTSELQSLAYLVCRLLLEKKKKKAKKTAMIVAHVAH